MPRVLLRNLSPNLDGTLTSYALKSVRAASEHLNRGMRVQIRGK